MSVCVHDVCRVVGQEFLTHIEQTRKSIETTERQQKRKKFSNTQINTPLCSSGHPHTCIPPPLRPCMLLNLPWRALIQELAVICNADAEGDETKQQLGRSAISREKVKALAYGERHHNTMHPNRSKMQNQYITVQDTKGFAT